MLRVVEERNNGRTLKSEKIDAHIMNASQRRGYRDAMVYVKKYAKAMKVLAND